MLQCLKLHCLTGVKNGRQSSLGLGTFSIMLPDLLNYALTSSEQDWSRIQC